MRIIAVIDLNDEDLVEAYDLQDAPAASPWGGEWDDLFNSIDARLLEAGYMGSFNHPVRGELKAAAPIDVDALVHLLACAEVGAEGSGDQDLATSVLGAVRSLENYDLLPQDEV